jgi:unsaturated rhamnogalacturonyl hydrolase
MLDERVIVAENKMADYAELLGRVARQTLSLSLNRSEADVQSGVPEAARWVRWDWSIGVAFYGLLQASEFLGDPALITGMKKWLDERLADATRLPMPSINTTALLPLVLHLYEMTGDPKYEQVCQFFDNYLLNEIPRTPDGAWTHTVVGRVYSNEVWADTLFMAGLYMVRRGRFLQNDHFLQEAARQFELHFAMLYDEQSRLFYHGWDAANWRALGVKWGRGNAWALASAIEYLEIWRKLDVAAPIWLPTIQNQVEALLPLQTADGSWRTVLDSPATYPETSATAGIAYGLAKGVRLGIWHSAQAARYLAAADQAGAALARQIDAEGNVLGGSTGTPIKADANEYNNVPCRVTPFTQGLALLALSEFCI